MIDTSFLQLTEELRKTILNLAPALDKFNKAMEQAAQQVIANINSIDPEVFHAIGMLHPREVTDHYFREVAEPDEVVEFILNQPKYTWNGVTIYPDEAWRYRGKTDWMWWRE